MKARNKIELTNPFMNISGKVEREKLDYEIKFSKENNISSKFIRRRIVFFMDGYRYAAQAVQKRWGINFTFFESGHDQVKKAYFTENLDQEAGELWWKMMEKDKNFPKTIVKELLDIIELEKKIAKSIPQRELNRKELEEYLIMHLDWWITFFEVGYLWFCAEQIKNKIDLELGKNWKDFYLGKEKVTLENFKESVYRPMKWPMSSVEQRDLFSIVKSKSQDKDLKKHVERYKHLSLHNIDDEYFNLEYFQSRLKIMKEEKEYQNQKYLIESADSEVAYANKILKSAPVPDWIKDRIEFVRWFMYGRTESVDHFMLVNSAYKAVFSSLAKEFELAIDEVLHMTYEEIISSLRKGKLSVSKELIKSRTHEGYAFLIGVKNSYLTTGKEVDVLHNMIVPEENTQGIKELKGQSAFKGFVRGKARIILDRRNAHELKKDEILVTTMTTPDFVPAMKISGGIVTNEGGILCHAAIMSRELRKPCVIGTKKATDVIKTGDLIEVDANTGKVRILS